MRNLVETRLLSSAQSFMTSLHRLRSQKNHKYPSTPFWCAASSICYDTPLILLNVLVSPAPSQIYLFLDNCSQF